MQPIERQIAALEANSNDGIMKIVIVEDGETQADALNQAGYEPDALGVVYGTPLDAML